MKKVLFALLAFLLFGAACGSAAQGDFPAALMAEGEIYLLPPEPSPVEIDPSAVIGYTSSYTDGFPERDGETNFSRELGLPYARVEGGIAILYEGEWWLCPLGEQTGG